MRKEEKLGQSNRTESHSPKSERSGKLYVGFWTRPHHQPSVSANSEQLHSLRRAWTGAFPPPQPPCHSKTT